MPEFRKTFTEDGNFAAYDSAVAFLEQRGFSVGRMKRGSPMGILFGSYDIAKWHLLTDQHRKALHGLLTGRPRHGPMELVIFEGAPVEAHAALEGQQS